MCNPEPCSSWATRVRVMKCDHAVQLCTCCICGCTVHTPLSVGWSFFSRQPKLVLTLREKITNRQGLKNAENSNCSSSNGIGPTLTTMTKLSAGWPQTLTKLSAGFTATFCRITNLFSGQLRSHILLALDLLSFSQSYLLIARIGSVFFLGARHAILCILFSLEQSRVVIEWWLRYFSI